ncbi:MAG: hypothetical protein JWO82_2129 [Akkermansiaceae bacterium]|nr:hypothetical protein [Akkermansiaceae bacterium]
MDDQSRLPRPDRDRSLHEVIQDFGASLRPGGPDGEIDEWSVYDETFRRLVRWAENAGCFFEGFQPLKEGGREHDLIFDSVTLNWLKFTKPAAAGYVVSFDSHPPSLGPGLPLEYLERLLLQNAIFADTVTFVGIGGERHRPRLITRQADVPGENASPAEIRELMAVLDFHELPPAFSLGYDDSLAFARHDAAVFDLRPANVVKTADGLIVPIDAIATALDDSSRAALGV